MNEQVHSVDIAIVGSGAGGMTAALAAHEAIAAMRARQQGEYDRLQSLAQVNPNIRQREIEHIATTTEALAEAMARAEWRLDAIRLALTI